MPSVNPPPTFRDPAGSLTLGERTAVRTIREEAAAETLAFLTSGLCARLESNGAMVESRVIEASGEYALRLEHPRIPVITYPWEWTPGQWLAAAELTLSLCEQALQDGWILKDATPLNILFMGPRPVLVDVLSFERHKAGDSIWLAYGQYVRTFLLPLLTCRLLHWPLAMTLFRRDGYEPAEIYAALSWPQRLSGAALVPVTLPALLDKRKGDAKQAVPPKKDPELALHLLRGTLRGLRKRTQRAMPMSASSEWSDYTSSLTHYTEQESTEKLTFVREVLANLQPSRVLDIGANTGEFSALAAASGASVVALERDAAAADRLYQRVSAQKLDVLTIHADLARPTPAVGWDNTESMALLDRLEGQFELVMMLAVIHHLLLMEQIPLQRILDLMLRLTKRHLLLEWVPVTDPMFQSLMRGRDELYGAMSEEDLLRACDGRFGVLQRQPLQNGRVLFLLERV